MSQPANGNSNALQVTARSGPGEDEWTAGLVESDSVVLVIGGGMAVTPDGDEMLVAVSDSGRPPRISHWPPYSVRKYSMPDAVVGTLGQEHGRFLVGDGIPFEVLVTGDGRLAHVLTNLGEIFTIAVETLEQTEPAIEFERPPYSLAAVGSLHAALAPDERTLAVNLLDEGKLVVADLVDRSARTVDLPSAHESDWVGGVSFSRGPESRGLLAVHRRTQVDVYRMDPGGNLDRVGFTRIAAPYWEPTANTVFASIEWSQGGSQIIAATDSSRGFVVLDVLDEGSTLAERGALAPCSAASGQFQNMPNDILTSNDWVAPTPTTSPSATPTEIRNTKTPTRPAATATPTATQAPSAAVSPPATPTLTATSVGTRTTTPPATPTTKPLGPAYVPLALSESCRPRDVFADAALVIDASTSMLDPTAGRQKKIDIAVGAARLFVDGLRMRPGEDRTAVVAFNDTAHTLLHLTHDRARVDESLDRIRITEHSRVDLGIERAMVELIKRGRHGRVQAMIVLSDGKSNPVPGARAVAASGRAQLEGITVYVVGMGPSLDEVVLRAMASGDDRYFPARDPLLVEAIYADLTRRVPCPPAAYWGRR